MFRFYVKGKTVKMTEVEGGKEQWISTHIFFKQSDVEATLKSSVKACEKHDVEYEVIMGDYHDKD